MAAPFVAIQRIQRCADRRCPSRAEGHERAAALLHLALIQLRRAEVTEETRPWVPVIRRVEPLLPWVALAVFGTGAWLIHLSGGEVTWDQGWIVTSIVALVVAEGVGGMLSRPSQSLTEAVLRAPDGSITKDLRDQTA